MTVVTDRARELTEARTPFVHATVVRAQPPACRPESAPFHQSSDLAGIPPRWQRGTYIPSWRPRREANCNE